MSKVKSELKKLDEMTANEIAEHLAANHVTGFVASAACCPIVNYLRKMTAYKAKVTASAQDIMTQYLFVKTFKTPPNVKSFIVQFDRGMYPELVS